MQQLKKNYIPMKLVIFSILKKIKKIKNIKLIGTNPKSHLSLQRDNGPLGVNN